MKHHLTSAQAATILGVLQKIIVASDKIPVMLSAIDIDKNDLNKCKQVIINLWK
jgi:hypothetical protein